MFHVKHKQMAQSRRSFITGFASFLVAAPAIVKAANIMPVKAILEFEKLPFQYQAIHTQIALGYTITRKAIDNALYGATFPVDAKIAEYAEINWARLLRDTNIPLPPRAFDLSL